MPLTNPTFEENLIFGSPIGQVAPYGTRILDRLTDDSEFRFLGNHDPLAFNDTSTTTDYERSTRAVITRTSNQQIEIPIVLEDFDMNVLKALYNNSSGFKVTSEDAESTGTTRTQTLTVDMGVTYNNDNYILLDTQPLSAPSADNDWWLWCERPMMPIPR